jgi:(p)ppGpp synthase/HD superfamily hydrolase
MSLNDLGVHQVLDIVGIRAVTRYTDHCYQLVDLIHREFETLECEYDDYIAAPKTNGYKSIHTTVVSPWGFPVEVQVRTQSMHAFCERGPAAHARYKANRIPWIPLTNGVLVAGGVT